MRSKLLTSLLIILMITVQWQLCFADNPEQTMTDGVFSYNIIEGKAVLTSCSDQQCKTVTIPKKLGGYPLESIEGGAFSLCKNLISFKTQNPNFEVYGGALYKEGTLVCYPPAKNQKVFDAPSFMSEIMPCAFFGNTTLTVVSLNDLITTIPAEAFAGCTSLHTVELGENTTEISDGAFAFCASLKKIKIPETLNKIGSAAFYGCSLISDIELSDNISFIGEMAFKDCKSVTEINIPKNITDAENWIFTINPALEKVTVSEGSLNYAVVDGVLYTADMKKLVLCPAGGGIEKLTVPDGTIIIGRNSFENHKTIKTVTLPASVTEIEDRAFYDAAKLVSINLDSGVSKIGEYAFYSCGYLGSITANKAITSIGSGSFDDCISLTLYVADGSEIHEFAVKNNVNHRIDPNQPAIPREHWSQKYIEWAESTGVTAGVTDYTQTINQEGFCWLIMNLYEKYKGDAEIPANPFTDTSSPAVLKACGLGFAQGYSENTFAPARPITREEICVNLHHLITALNGEEPERGTPQTFRDSKEISEWAVSYISIAYNNSIISGLPDGRINPKGHASIEEAVAMLYNASLLIKQG